MALNQRWLDGVGLGKLKDAYGKPPTPGPCCQHGQECFEPVPSNPEPDSSRDEHLSWEKPSIRLHKRISRTISHPSPQTSKQWEDKLAKLQHHDAPCANQKLSGGSQLVRREGWGRFAESRREPERPTAWLVRKGWGMWAQESSLHSYHFRMQPHSPAIS